LNRKLKHILTLLLINLTTIGSVVYPNSNDSFIQVDYHLAISINPGGNSGYINYAIIGETNGKLMYTKFISCSEFILIGMGEQWSAANDLGVNIFEQFNIKDCLYKYDSAECKKKT
jgi:hypothetical protein